MPRLSLRIWSRSSEVRARNVWLHFEDTRSIHQKGAFENFISSYGEELFLFLIYIHHFFLMNKIPRNHFGSTTWYIIKQGGFTCLANYLCFAFGLASNWKYYPASKMGGLENKFDIHGLKGSIKLWFHFLILQITVVL